MRIEIALDGYMGEEPHRILMEVIEIHSSIVPGVK